MLIRTYIDQVGNGWVTIRNGDEIVSVTQYTNPTVNSTIPLAQGTIGGIGADAIRMMFKKMDKDIAVVHKLFGLKAVVVPHAKYCSRTHVPYDNGCDRTLDPAVIAARHAELEQVK